MIKITGLHELQKELAQAQQALRAIDGQLGSVSFDPQDPGSVEAAIRSMEALIDEKLASYSSNGFVTELASSMKAQYREGILERAATERLKRKDGSE